MSSYNTRSRAQYKPQGNPSRAGPSGPGRNNAFQRGRESERRYDNPFQNGRQRTRELPRDRSPPPPNPEEKAQRSWIDPTIFTPAMPPTKPVVKDLAYFQALMRKNPAEAARQFKEVFKAAKHGLYHNQTKFGRETLDLLKESGMSLQQWFDYLRSHNTPQTAPTSEPEATPVQANPEYHIEAFPPMRNRYGRTAQHQELIRKIEEAKPKRKHWSMHEGELGATESVHEGNKPQYVPPNWS